MKYKKYLIIAAALAFIGAASVGPAMAYFTDSHIATGMVAIDLGDSELTPTESVEGMVKTIQVENSGNYEVYIRVKALYGSTVGVEKLDGDKWSLAEDGYYYYSDVVEAGGITEELKLIITAPADTKQDSFNVVIVEEATRVTYADDGTLNAADWSLANESKTIVDGSQSTNTETDNTNNGEDDSNE